MTTHFDGEDSNTLFNSLEEGGQGVFSLMVDPRQVIAVEAKSPVASTGAQKFELERSIRVGQELRIDIRPDSVSPKANDVTVVWSNGFEGSEYQVQPEDVGTTLFATARFAGEDMRPLEVKIECGDVLVGPPPVIDTSQIVVVSDETLIQELVSLEVGIAAAAFSMPVESVQVAWLLDGVIVETREDILPDEDGTGYYAEFCPADESAGQVLSVRVIGRAAGCEDGVVTINCGVVAPGREIQLSPQAKIRIREPRVGKKSKISFEPTEFEPVPQTLLFQWMINGEAVEGETKAKFRPNPAHRGRKLSVLVIAEHPGYLHTAVDVFLGVIAPGYEPEYYGEPLRLKGKAKVDGKLKVANLDRNLFEPSPQVIEYQWMRAKEQIPGARRKSYSPTPDDLGSKVWARVYAKIDGHRTQVMQTNKIRIK